MGRLAMHQEERDLALARLEATEALLDEALGRVESVASYRHDERCEGKGRCFCSKRRLEAARAFLARPEVKARPS